MTTRLIMSVKIFLSATFIDLKEERGIIVEAFRRFRVKERLDVDLLTMEDFGVSTDDTLSKWGATISGTKTSAKPMRPKLWLDRP